MGKLWYLFFPSLPTYPFTFPLFAHYCDSNKPWQGFLKEKLVRGETLRSLRRIYAAPRRSLFANKVCFLTFVICTLVVEAVCRILVVAGFCKAKYWKWHCHGSRSESPRRSIFAFCASRHNHNLCQITNPLEKSKMRIIGTHSSHPFRFYFFKQSWII